MTGRREDGFHELETIFHGIALADTLEMTRSRPGEIEVEMRLPAHSQSHLPPPEGNLVRIAAAHVSRLAPRPAGASIVVTKEIAIGAGMAGGSSDAAATIVGLNALWGLGLTRRRLLGIAAMVGSDVPYCLDGGTVLATGRGTEMTRLAAAPEMWFVLGISHRPLMTRAVYDAWDRVGASGPDVADAMTGALARRDVIAIAALLHNDLYPPALSLRPEIEAGCRALIEAGALGAGMAGSGPTVFALAGSERHAREVASAVRDHFPQVEVVASAPRSIERI
ncbi:MAG: 4-(cytidine 5'-diphospho)-2-C-methyl-D-erythritol kinase [Actinomycetota bacterium]|nr:4-(cytidine 5'-diphospho)-2-C-methyl-D-erythritol kinase [Actinomycetota bacterium]